MSYFNHAFKKTFVATKASQDGQGLATVEHGILTQEDVHVSELKNQAAPYQLGPGVVGFFDSKTHLSVVGSTIAADCCPFYLAGAAIKLQDKQGPFHGGYQESNKSKVINPKYLRKMWKVEGNVGSQAILELGGTLGNNGGALGAVLSLDGTSLVPGSGYVAGVDVATTTGGAGSGLTVDVATTPNQVDTITFLPQGDVARTNGVYVGVASTSDGAGTGATFDVTVDAATGVISALTVNAAGDDYVGGDVETITISDAVLGGGGAADVTFTVTTVGGTGTVSGISINAPGEGYVVGDVITVTTGGADATIEVLTVDGEDECYKEFLCGETYYLRIDVKGTAALRFANHNLYRTLDASGGCCADPAIPTAVDPVTIYAQWAVQVAEDPYLKDFVMPVLVADGQSYAYNAEQAAILGLDPTLFLFENAPLTTTTAGLILMGAYYDTTFADCTFQCSDYYGIEPIQIFASEVDLNGDPCTFETLCVVERCPGIQANGTGEQKVRDLILAESYLQNFVSTDLRIREITQGTRAYEVLDRSAIYSSMFLLHSVPRFNNPSGVFDNDQYLLEIVGTPDTLTVLEAELGALIEGGCITCGEIEDLTAVADCSFRIPEIVVL